MTLDSTKAALRTELRARRAGFVGALTSVERAELETRAASHLLPLIAGARCVAFYIAIGDEFDCGPAMDATAQRGIAIALPHVTGRDAPMRFLRWLPGEPLETGWAGLLQPHADSPEIEPDIIVTPLLGFDSAMARIGQGAGFYDRVFATRKDVKKIGLGWSIQQSSAIGCDPWDVSLDAVVTEMGLIEAVRT